MKNNLISLLTGNKNSEILTDKDLAIQKKQIQIIQDVSSAIAGILQVSAILDAVPKALIKSLGYKICSVQLIDEEGKNLKFHKINAPDSVLKAVKKFMGFSIYDLKIPLTMTKSWLVRSFLEKKEIIGDDLYLFDRPFVSAGIAHFTQKVMRIKDIIAIPLIIRGESIGVLSVGSAKKIAEFEIDFLKTFANQIAIALYNAQLLEEQKAQYAELQAAYKKLEELNRLQSIDRAKNEFIRVVSHQFRTPLSGIRFEAEYILEKRERGDLAENESMDALILIYDRILSLIMILNDMFDVLEIDQGETKLKRELVSFADVAKEAESIIRQPFVYTQNKKKLIISVDAVKRPVSIDKEKIKRILVILLNNAFTFTANDGKISLKAKLKNKGKDRMLNITVKDNGIGIPAPERNKVFEKFYRAPNASKTAPNGTGLGLYIVKNFVQMHGGTIIIKDAGNKGVVFDITLPV